MTTTPTWAIMPVTGNPALTETALASVLRQSVPVRVLVVNQGVEDDFRDHLERIAEADARVLVWSHQPPLPSLAATWNRALDFVWAAGGTEALVVNNDVELHAQTIAALSRVQHVTSAYFVSAVGRRAEDWFPDVNDRTLAVWLEDDLTAASIGRGGPDFSCFLLTREGHQRFRFDDHFTPAYCEDLDYHRQLLLAGYGSRIFSVNVPYLHHGSGTLKTLDEAARAQVERAIEQGSRAYYRRCWGGPVNQERYVVKSDPASARDHVTTPELQARCMAGEAILGGDSPLASSDPAAP